MANDYLVLGLGRFGQAVCRRLVEKGHSVMAVDNNKKRVQEVADWVTQAASLDVTDQEALEEIEASQFETAIVAIGSNFEASLLAVIVLKELGVKTVIAKALTDLHEKALHKIGADEVVFPERDAGYALGEKLSQV